MNISWRKPTDSVIELWLILYISGTCGKNDARPTARAATLSTPSRRLHGADIADIYSNSHSITLRIHTNHQMKRHHAYFLQILYKFITQEQETLPLISFGRRELAHHSPTLHKIFLGEIQTSRCTDVSYKIFYKLSPLSPAVNLASDPNSVFVCGG